MWWLLTHASALAADAAPVVDGLGMAEVGGGVGVLALLGVAIRELASVARSKQKTHTVQVVASPADDPDIIRALSTLDLRITLIRADLDRLHALADDIRTLATEVQNIARMVPDGR